MSTLAISLILMHLSSLILALRSCSEEHSQDVCRDERERNVEKQNALSSQQVEWPSGTAGFEMVLFGHEISLGTFH